MARWALIAVLGGCSHAASPPPAPPVVHALPADAAVVADARALDDDLPRLAARSLQLYQELAAAVSPGGDCAAITAKLDALDATYADVIAANARVRHAGHDKIAALEQELVPHHADLDAAAKAIADAPVLAQCAQDPAFTQAMDRLAGAS